jgi:glycosyltransferase involved in cell wall biosynthesis
MNKLKIIWYASLGTGLSGGDNILIELARRWTQFNIEIYTGVEGAKAGVRKELFNVKYNVCPSYTPFRYIERLIWSLITAFRIKDGIVYTSSDFFHDIIVGWICKKRGLRWIAGYYLIAPNPFKRTHYPFIRGFGYWLIQRLTLRMAQSADVVYVTSEPDRKYFKNTVVIRGGVDLTKVGKLEIPTFDAVFMGRLHYQKGILELIDIWRLVVNVIPSAKLLIVGSGALYNKMAAHIQNHNLQLSIDYIEFADDEKKQYIFSHSKIILHPSVYDSGGMSCAEGMAWGLPAVGFKLPVFDTYYPSGLIQATDKQDFAEQIIKLLTNSMWYIHVSDQAKALIKDYWNWDNRAKEIYYETNFGQWLRG